MSTPSSKNGGEDKGQVPPTTLPQTPPPTVLNKDYAFLESTKKVVEAVADIKTFANAVQEAARSIDKSAAALQDNQMPRTDKDYIDAKLETIEARMDGRVAAITSKIDAYLGMSDEREKATADKFARLEQSFSEVKHDSKTMKYWLIGTGLATVIGLFGANIAMVQTMGAMFESGKSLSTAQANINSAQIEVKKQVEETGVLLKQLQQSAPAHSVKK